MQHLKNLKIYTPDDEYSLFLMKEHSAEFFISDDGRDWYESQASFLPDTLKVAYDEAGIIRSISRDVSSIYPRDFSVAEVDITGRNQSVDISGGWVFSEGKLNLASIHRLNCVSRRKHKKRNYWLPPRLKSPRCRMPLI